MSMITTSPKVSAWKTIPLRVLLQRVRKPLKVEADKEYQEIGIRSHGKGIFHKEKRTGASLGNKSVFWVEPNCFVVNIVFAWEQAIAKTTTTEQGMIASHRFPMYKPRDGVLDLDFLVYYFNSPRGVYLLGLASPGGAGRNRTLGQEEFLSLSIPLPPFHEQRRIAQILAVWDNAIGLTKQLIAAKQQRKKGLMQQLLTGQRRFSEFGEAPWKTARLKELLDIRYGKSPKGIRKDSGPYFVYGTGGVVGKTDQVLCDEPAIIIGRKGTIDQPQLVLEPFWAIDTTYFGVPKHNVDVHWVYYALQTIKLQRYNEASGVPSLSRDTLYNICIPVPGSDEQKRISGVLKACDTEIDLLRQKLDALQLQKKGLMQQLLTGRVRVRPFGSPASK